MVLGDDGRYPGGLTISALQVVDPVRETTHVSFRPPRTEDDDEYRAFHPTPVR
jgi:hypothetical protein